jgi:hypothetical protein
VSYRLNLIRLFLVHGIWGIRDDTAVWFYQVVRGEIRVMDYYAVIRRQH